MVQHAGTPPELSVVVCTRDRPADLRRCLPTILASQDVAFELVVVDQSRADVAGALAAQLGDPRLTTVRDAGTGLSRARNIGLRHCHAQAVAFTDDDCTVGPGWAAHVARCLREQPDAVLFGQVAPAPHDPAAEFIPVFAPPVARRIRGRFARAHRLGIGANMAATRRVFDAIGGFSEVLGAGARYPSAEDCDLAYRALRAGLAVAQDPACSVLHWGARPYAGGTVRRLIAQGFRGIGAMYGLHVRRGDGPAAAILAREAAIIAGEILRAAATGRRPLGIARLLNLLAGAGEALRHGGATPPPGAALYA